jgi:3D (Asp-Asp-Asp) domain-containing protein
MRGTPRAGRRHEANMRDLRNVLTRRRAVSALALVVVLVAIASLTSGPRTGTRLHEFMATAYCVDGITRAGVRVQPGIVAADPDVLPLGSVVRIEEPRSHAGVYSVLDTGGAIVGEILDVYVPDCDDAVEFGRRTVTFRVLRLGWDPTSGA